jgi:hypothetical protein
MFKITMLYIEWALTTFFGFTLLVIGGKYCPEWDLKLLTLMESREPKLGRFTIHFGDAEVWIANRFYGYGNLWRYCNKNLSEVVRCKRPSVSTMIKLALIHDRLLHEYRQKQDEESIRLMRDIR